MIQFLSMACHYRANNPTFPTDLPVRFPLKLIAALAAASVACSIGPTAKAEGANAVSAGAVAGSRAKSAATAELPYALPPDIEIAFTTKSIKIDGILDDEAWQEAAIIDRFIQVEPVEGGKPSEETEVRIVQNSRFFYLGVRCFDSNPAGIITTQMVADGPMLSDDRINLVFDTFHDHRNAFFFQVNSVGTRSEARIENSSLFRREWDGIWYAKARKDELGWTAEFAIPFQTLSLEAGDSVWGFEIERMIRRKNERIRWSNISQSRSIIRVGDIGTVSGLKNMDRGLGLDVKTSLSATHQWSADERDSDMLLRPSLDLFYDILPSLRASLTVNTDFSEADVDDRRTNLTRFSLFFPETRDFFVKDAGIFEFGGLEQNGTPFFSRRIGIDASGNEVDLQAGVKVAGRAGRFNIGILDVQTASGAVTGDGQALGAKNLSVARISANVGEESRAGVIFTNGDPGSDGDNRLAGIDFRYQDSKVAGTDVLIVDAWMQRSSSSGVSGKESAYGWQIDYPNDRWRAGASFREFQDNFRPALGFSNRVGIRQYNGDLRYRIRPQNLIRTADAGIAAEIVTGSDDKLQSQIINFNLLTLENNPGDRISLSYKIQRERFYEPFAIVPSVVIEPGDYDFNRNGLSIASTIARPISVELSVDWGDFYSGNLLEGRALLALRPSPHFFCDLEYEYNAANLDEGDFTTHLSRLRVDINFTPDLSWRNFAQYDNLTDNVGLNSRLRWIVEPGDELLLVLNNAYDFEQGSFDSRATEMTGKVEWTFRF